ncbi:MAG TPA: monovalent cation/H(+) antiporter subunit G [Anaerolineae bacterium]|nr:monovalent cation/H(+) antiporter subunit G [Anaerolineae bacterium]
MTLFFDLIIIILIIFGSLLMLIASIGLIVMPDVFLRMSASTKAATAGVSSILLAAALHFGTADNFGRAIATIGFLFLTAPVGAHMIARAAYVAGDELYEKTHIDDLKQKYAHERKSPPREDIHG